MTMVFQNHDGPRPDMCLVVPLGWDGKPRLRDWIIAPVESVCEPNLMWDDMTSYSGDLP
jgi:hypothetical protein